MLDQSLWPDFPLNLFIRIGRSFLMQPLIVLKFYVFIMADQYSSPV